MTLENEEKLPLGGRKEIYVNRNTHSERGLYVKEEN